MLLHKCHPYSLISLAVSLPEQGMLPNNFQQLVQWYLHFRPLEDECSGWLKNSHALFKALPDVVFPGWEQMPVLLCKPAVLAQVLEVGWVKENKAERIIRKWHTPEITEYIRIDNKPPPVAAGNICLANIHVHGINIVLVKPAHPATAAGIKYPFIAMGAHVYSTPS